MGAALRRLVTGVDAAHVSIATISVHAHAFSGQTRLTDRAEEAVIAWPTISAGHDDTGSASFVAGVGAAGAAGVRTTARTPRADAREAEVVDSAEEAVIARVPVEERLRPAAAGRRVAPLRRAGVGVVTIRVLGAGTAVGRAGRRTDHGRSLTSRRDEQNDCPSG